ncbi:MAG: RNA-binding protein [Muricomes sp.]
MNYYNNYGYYGADSVATGILAIYGIIFVLYCIFGIISYIFKGIGMYTIAKRQGKDYPWLAFIPFARKYLQGELAGEINLKSKSVKNPGIWFLALPFIFGAISFVLYIIMWIVTIVPMIGSLASNPYAGSYIPDISAGAIMGFMVMFIILILVYILYGAVYSTFRVLINHQILGNFTTKNMSIVHGVLCLLVPLYESICFFIMRNKDFNPGMEPDLGTPFVQPTPFVVPVGNVPEQPSYKEAEPAAANTDETAEAKETTETKETVETEKPQGSETYDEYTEKQDHPDTTE